MGGSQEIEAYCYAVKGLGKDHAKWSPVCTAWYRMLPEILLPKPFVDDRADALVDVCPMKVFEIEELADRREAVVKDARKCTTCRACLEKFGDDVVIQKVKTHFIFE